MSIEIEYKQWLFLYEEMFKGKRLIPTLFNPIADIKKCKKAILHWLVYVNQDRSIDKYEHFPLLPKICSIDESTPEWAWKLVTYIEEKKLFSKQDEGYNREESRLAVERFLKYIQEKHDALQLEGLNLEPIREYEEITFENFTRGRYTQLPYLLKNISEGSWSLADITKMIMRYESFNDNNLFQGSFHNDLYTCLYNDFDVRFEGFASPLNAHLLEKSDYQFCSLFPDTDAVFGSKGNFFELKLSELSGVWLINPPFVEDILDKVAKTIIAALGSEVRGTYLCVYPQWNDNTGWNNLQNSDYTIESWTKSVQCLYDEFGNEFSYNKEFSFFCLSSDKSLNLQSVENILNNHFN